jgi:hypothetical protein
MLSDNYVEKIMIRNKIQNATYDTLVSKILRNELLQDVNVFQEFET